MTIGTTRLSSTTAILLLILAGGLALRLIGLSFGLPSLYDPDEPFFIITGLKLLKDHTLNPGWFGHPGTTTVYVLALIELVVVSISLATGRFADVQEFGRTVYSDPGIVFIPARLFIVLCGVACIALTFLAGRRLFGDRVGLTAAALLAVNPLHITFSQIIRTDVQASVFLLLALLATIGIVERGRARDYLLAGLWVGFACATKWPAATVCAAIPGACLTRCIRHPGAWRGQAALLAAGMAACIAGLFVASPYIFLDSAQVIRDVSGEAQPYHLGATGGGFLANIGWYAAHPLRDSFGIAGLLLAGTGLAVAVARHPGARGTVVLAAAVFVVAICSQRLIWSRWIVPLLPLVALFVAVGLWALAGWVRRTAGREIAGAVAGVAIAGLCGAMLVSAAGDARERLHDTRGDASAWARAHIPPGSHVLVEYLAFDLLPQPWRFLFPAGRKGCIDGNKALHGQVRASEVSGFRGSRSIVDIGTIDPRALGACRADYAILTDYDRYLADSGHFTAELGVYHQLARGGEQVAIFRPVRGETGGPVVRIIRLSRHDLD